MAEINGTDPNYLHPDWDDPTQVERWLEVAVRVVSQGIIFWGTNFGRVAVCSP